LVDVLVSAVLVGTLLVTTTVMKPEGELTEGPTLVGGAVATVDEPGNELEEAAEVELAEGEVVPPLLRYDGGGIADDGLLSEPVTPGNLLAVPGCVALGATVVWPELVAMVNRPVHCLSGTLGQVNW
jgi:hypothetical protein